MAFPTIDSLLVPYSGNFDSRINVSPTTFGLSAEQAGIYTPLHMTYVDSVAALTGARAHGMHSTQLTIARDTARTALLAYGRQLYGMIQANGAVSDENKSLLGIHLRSGNTRVDPPDVAPGLEILSVVGRTVHVRVFDSTSESKRGKARGATAGWVYSYAGADYPSDPVHWDFQGAATRGKFKFVVPDTVPNGSQLWICAAWVTRRGDTSPACLPLTVNVQGGGVTTATGDMKLAA